MKCLHYSVTGLQRQHEDSQLTVSPEGLALGKQNVLNGFGTDNRTLKSKFTFTCLLWGWVTGLPPIKLRPQIRTRHPTVHPNMEVPGKICQIKDNITTLLQSVK